MNINIVNAFLKWNKYLKFCELFKNSLIWLFYNNKVCKAANWMEILASSQNNFKLLFKKCTFVYSLWNT